MNNNGAGTLALLGSGETSSQGRKIHDYLMSHLPVHDFVRVAILETPAGFQPNAGQVYRKVGEFLEKSLQNFHPQLQYIAAHKKGGPNDTNDPTQVKPLLDAQYIFTGPGSPTYAARNLLDTVTAGNLVEAYNHGATLVLSSAAALATGRYVMRVYEIFKAGADLGWDPGLSLLDALGFAVDPIVVTHWNNAEGGAGLDTTHCYVGKDRFERLLEMLPAQVPVLGIDEHTACIFEPGSDEVRVMGAGGATILNGTDTIVVPSGSTFPLSLLGSRVPAHHGWSSGPTPAAKQASSR